MAVIQVNVRIKNGVIYHRDGINGDYDDFDDVETLIEFIKNPERQYCKLENTR